MKNLFNQQYKNLSKLYRKAVYVCCETGWILRIDQQLPDIDQYMDENQVTELCILTAYNPGSVLRDDSENHFAMKELIAVVEKENHFYFKGLNRDPLGKFPDEETLWVWGMNLNKGKATGFKFGQKAIVFYKKGGKAELIRTTSC